MNKGGMFDVTMEVYDGTEVCEIFGTFLLDKISVKYDKNSTNLSFDNGLSVFKNSTWKNKKELYCEDTLNKAGYMDKVVFHSPKRK